MNANPHSYIHSHSSLSRYLNAHHEVVYKLVHGDKDTFRVAFHLAGKMQDYYQVPVFARDAMREVPGHKHRFHHLGMFHASPNGSLVIFHRTSFNR